jgi:thymidylate synthase (FAD)
MTVKIATPLTQAKQELKDLKKPLIEIGNYGFVALMGIYGSDESIAQTARITTQSDHKNPRPLLRHLMRHYHTSPFENSHIDLEIALPIFIERQMARHRTAGWNEISARYCELPCEQWEIEPDRYQMEPKEGENRQGSGEQFDPEVAILLEERITNSLENSVGTYKYLRNNEFTPELSRTVLPLNTFTRKRWWVDLHNLMNFLRLREHKDAQYEIRLYADAIHKLVEPHFPIIFQAFRDFRLEAMQLSRIERQALKELLNGNQEIDHLFDSKTELKEFREKIEKL